MEWKSFLGKKVKAESAAAAKQVSVLKKKIDPSPSLDRRLLNDDTEESEEDSLFEFKSSASEQYGAFPNSVPPLLDDFSDLSPIQPQDEETPKKMEEVSDTGTNLENHSFLKRLQACATPIIPRQLSGQVCENRDILPSAHIAFLRSNSPEADASPKDVPKNLCGHHETIREEAALQDANNNCGQSKNNSAKRERECLNPKDLSSEVPSVVSDERFGAKTSMQLR